MMVSVFAIGPGDWGLISGRAIPNTEEMVLDVSLLNIQYYKVRIKGKRRNPGKGIAPSSIIDIKKEACASPSIMVG